LDKIIPVIKTTSDETEDFEDQEDAPPLQDLNEI
jgi:hypothetical protein